MRGTSVEGYKPLSKAYPLLVLATSAMCQACAGTVYWFPAIAPGLSRSLLFSTVQSTVVVATASSGSVFGILGGFLHDAYGSRITASAGAFGLLACYAILAILSFSAPPLPTTILFIVVIIVTTCIVTFSFMLYSSCLTAAVKVFPPQFRGRVVGLNSTMYGGSAGFFAAMQSAFFPSLHQITPMLVTASIFMLITAIATFSIFPSAKHYDTMHPTAGGEEAPLQPPSAVEYLSARMRLAYRVASTT